MPDADYDIGGALTGLVLVCRRCGCVISWDMRPVHDAYHDRLDE